MPRPEPQALAAPAEGERSAGAPVLVYVVLAALFTAAILQFASNYGRLLVGPLYDDVIYINEGLEYAQLLQTQGPVPLAKRVVRHPPHSPFATGIAFLSFVVLGPRQWAPYAAMGLIVLAVLLAVDRLLAGLPRHARLAGALFALTFPIVGTLPEHFRPDATAGLVTGFGVVLVLRVSPLWAPRPHQYATGLLFALAAVVKTSVLPFTMFMFGASWLLSVWAGRRTDLLSPGRTAIAEPRRGWRGYWSAAWPYALPLLLVAAPYYLLAWRTVYRYIYDNLFGQNREIWRQDGDWAGVLRFLWDGQGGRLLLGHHGYVVLGLAVLAGFYRLARRQGRPAERRQWRTAVAFTAAVSLAWLFPTLSRYGNPFTGSTFVAIVLFAGVLLLRRLFLENDVATERGRWRPTPGALLGWGAVAVALMATRSPMRLGTRATDSVARDNRVERLVYDTIVEHANGNGARVFVTNAANLNADLLRYRALVDHSRLEFSGPPFSSDLEEFRRPIGASDYVVTGDQGAFHENNRLPFHQLQNRLVADLRTDSSFTLLATVPAHQGLNIYVFGRKPSFGGWTRAERLGPLEGPFPPAGNRMVRWGLAPATNLAVTSAADRPGLVELTAVAMRPGQAVEVLVNGASVGRTSFAEREDFKTVKVPVNWRAGENLVELRYAVAEAGPAGSARAVLYSALRVE